MTFKKIVVISIQIKIYIDYAIGIEVFKPLMGRKAVFRGFLGTFVRLTAFKGFLRLSTLQGAKKKYYKVIKYTDCYRLFMLKIC